jgi:glycosyltransferase involved in cell wall biosynthesis
MSKQSPLVSVIMNCHNGSKYLAQALDSLDLQTYKKWELIFFDNCSNDKSKEIIKNKKNKKIKYFFSKKKLKLYNARNLAIKNAKGKYITFLDTDDRWHKDKLIKQVNFFRKNKEYKIVYSNLYIIYGNKKNKKVWLKKNFQMVKYYRIFLMNM